MNADANLIIDKLKQTCTDGAISWDEATRPTAKRKIDFAGDESTSGPIELDIPLYVHDHLSCTTLDDVLNGSTAHGLEDFDTLDVDDYGASYLAINPSNSSPHITSNMSQTTEVSIHGSSIEFYFIYRITHRTFILLGYLFGVLCCCIIF